MMLAFPGISARMRSEGIDREIGSGTLCFINVLLFYSFSPDNFTNYAQLFERLRQF